VFVHTSPSPPIHTSHSHLLFTPLLHTSFCIPPILRATTTTSTIKRSLRRRRWSLCVRMFVWLFVCGVVRVVCCVCNLFLLLQALLITKHILFVGFSLSSQMCSFTPPIHTSLTPPIHTSHSHLFFAPFSVYLLFTGQRRCWGRRQRLLLLSVVAPLLALCSCECLFCCRVFCCRLRVRVTC